MLVTGKSGSLSLAPFCVLKVIVLNTISLLLPLFTNFHVLSFCHVLQQVLVNIATFNMSSCASSSSFATSAWKSSQCCRFLQQLSQNIVIFMSPFSDLIIFCNKCLEILPLDFRNIDTSSCSSFATSPMEY